MTRTKTVALAFYLGAALAGAAIGVAVDRLMVREQPHWYDRHEMRTRFFDDLHLTPAQRDSATAIFDERNRRDSTLTAPVRPAMDSAFAPKPQNTSPRAAPLIAPPLSCATNRVSNG